jgi:VCBS repeat-containing protein
MNTILTILRPFLLSLLGGTLFSLLAPLTTIGAPNQAPIARNNSFSVNEDTTLQVSAPGVLGNDSDADQDPLTAILLSQPAHGTLTFSPTGAFTYTPAANFNGSDSFTYRANDGRANSATATVTITVNPVNDRPTARLDSYSVNEDERFVVFADGGVLANDSDVDGDALTASLVGSPEVGSVTLNTSGAFAYVPPTNFNGVVSFFYRASDGLLSALSRADITVRPLNDPPRVADRRIDVAANGVSGLVTLAGTDPDGDALTFQTCCGPLNGTLSGTPPVIRYTPNPGFVGDDFFVYRASDGQVPSESATVRLRVKPTVTITPLNATQNEGIGCLLRNICATHFDFIMTLSPAVNFPVTVLWGTREGTATADQDFQPRTDFPSTFQPGETRIHEVQLVYGDLDVEPDETLFLDFRCEEAILSRSSLTLTIVNDDQSIGVTEGVPPNVMARVGERFDYSVQWTHPERWRLLDTIEVRITDEEDEGLTVHFDETSNTFSLLEPRSWLRSAAPGERTQFETPLAVMYLEESEVIGSGPTGPSVLLKLNLSFKAQSAGHLFRVEAFATDDLGTRQGFDPVGTITVLPR